MAASERTPLLSSSRPSPSYTPTQTTRSPFTLVSQSNLLLNQYRSSLPPGSSSPSPRQETYDSPVREANLAIHLYALYLLNSDSRGNGPSPSIRSLLAHAANAGQVRAALCDAIEEMLDSGLGTHEEHEADGEEELSEILWTRWAVDDTDTGSKYASAMDLMLPPFVPSSTTSPFLSHPVIRHVLDTTWKSGIRSARHHDPSHISFVLRLRNAIPRVATPSRLHLAHMVSFLVLVGLTLGIAISPTGGLLTPYDYDDGRRRNISAVEIVWMICAGSSLLHTLQYDTTPLRCVLLFPTHLTFLVALFPSIHERSHTLLTLSIPTLTFLLVLPGPPSLPTFFKPLLPLSILLRRILYRSIRTAGLLMPLVVVLFGIFSWSMNGDIFRGFFVFSSVQQDYTAYGRSSLNVRQNDIIDSLADPIEVGVAPFQTRLMLFFTLTLLFTFSIILTAARAISNPRERWDSNDEKRWRGAVKESDEWEREYGLVVGREARRAWATSVRNYVWASVSKAREGNGAEEDGSRGEAAVNGVVDVDSHQTTRSYELLLPPPLNLISLPYDIYQTVVYLIRR
ncbi:hypothetical protein CI109_105170 [Kwoniella shandongensis]|uniref:Uncharacterized protein n=1 Tax=Kwoniella shandongensis TaxID=1734106 RepID=A0A5M6C3F4_9TREE|nr:uncharacterized protein CI109_002009 [Kwoniella shandongensis]KAA5529584.1 hypothetical protein CI109_002009 [Kwoniella shandongensis]